MWPLILLLVLSVPLGGEFGEARAEGRVVSSTLMEVELTVEAPEGRSVVVHLIEPGGPQQTVALAEQRPGLYTTVIEVRRVDLVAVFEVIGGDISGPVNLSRLGLDPALLGRVAASPRVGEPDPARWVWLAVAAGAAALSLLAFWALGEKQREEAPGEEASG